MKNPLILEIKGNSLDDGPGIRSVVFFKGCPLSCAWCHNPESKSLNVEISFEAGECVGCGTCLETCTENALSRDNPFYVDRTRCTLCFACVDACPSGALSRVGSKMAVDEIVDKVARDKPFYDNSGGGVTLSGGEPTLNMDFLGGLLGALKTKGIHTLLETCGLFDFGRFREKILPHLDMIYCDVKIMDEAEHKRLCGASNRVILDNLRQLFVLHQKGGVHVLPRIPLIPGMTDSDANLRAIASFYKECGVTETRLLPYHPLWQDKNKKIGVHDPRGETGAMKAFLDKERLEACKEIFVREGIGV